jgi:hypothetical protein
MLQKMILKPRYKLKYQRRFKQKEPGHRFFKLVGTGSNKKAPLLRS